MVLALNQNCSRVIFVFIHHPALTKISISRNPDSWYQYTLDVYKRLLISHKCNIWPLWRKIVYATLYISIFIYHQHTASKKSGHVICFTRTNFSKEILKSSWLGCAARVLERCGSEPTRSGVSHSIHLLLLIISNFFSIIHFISLISSYLFVINLAQACKEWILKIKSKTVTFLFHIYAMYWNLRLNDFLFLTVWHVWPDL